MADASSSRAEPKTLRGSPPPKENDPRPSSSTASRRHSHYDTQRTSRRESRPTSGGSQATWRSKGKQATPYDEPADFQNIGDVAAGGYVASRNPDSLEHRRTQDDVPESESRAQGIPPQWERSETAVPPPVQRPSEPPTSSSKSAQQKPLLDDPEAGDADDESSGAPAPFEFRRPEDYLARKRRSTPPPAPRWLTEIYTISYLVFFSILGTLARLGIQWLTYYPGAPIVTPVIWANFAGSLIMGFLSEDQALFQDEWTPSVTGEKRGENMEEMSKAEKGKRKKTIPLYIGLATGFCGSFTSFSSFARDFFLALSNSLPTPFNHPPDYAGGADSTSSTVSRHDGYSFEAWTAVVFYTLALSLGGLIVGAHIALFLNDNTPRIPIALTRRLIDPSVVFLGWGCWLGAVFLAIWPPDRPDGPSSRGTWANETWRGEVLFALVFAPAGCLLRFYASLKLNGLVPSFPLGTFAVNMLGTAIEGMCYDIQHVGVGISGAVGGGRTGCQVLQGVQDGFCGCLTTVSTWVAEINGLRRKHGYLYALASVMGGLCLMIVIMGSVRWTVGFGTPTCNTGYPNKIHG